MKEFYFNGKYAIQDMKVYTYGKVNIPTVTEEVTFENVPKRPQGALTIKTGNYKDIMIKCELQRNTDDLNILQDVIAWLTDINDNRIQFQRNFGVGKCYKVKAVEIVNIIDQGGANRMSVNFTCRPFIYKFLENEINISPNTATNIFIGGLKAFPKITFTCSDTVGANVVIECNNKQMTLENCKGNITIDNELMTARSTIDGNIRTIGNFFELVTGNNTIKVTSTGATNVKILKNEVFVI